MKKRPSWDEYFMAMAFLVATRSTCERRHVGAIIVRDKRILATGYNGPPAGLPHCDEVGCIRSKLGIPSAERQELCRGIHAEQNAIIQSALFGVSTEGSVLYCTNKPCITCAKILVNAKIKKIFVSNEYPDEFSDEIFKSAGIPVIYMPKPDMSFICDNERE